MSAVDPWPAAPVLEHLPPVARLVRSFDARALTDDLERLGPEDWATINVVTGDGIGRPATGSDWRTVPLRSIGGDPTRSDPGGPDLAEFSDTPWLDRLPAFRQLLRAIPGPLRSVRLMALGPGACSPLHSDTKIGLPWGTVRLHVPVVTLPEAVLRIAGRSHCWEPGALWYADFTRAHAVRNDGGSRRIHLVIDAQVTDALLALFPAPFPDDRLRSGFLVQPRGMPAEDAPTPPICRFDGPASFLSFEAADGEHVHDRSVLAMAIRGRHGQLVLMVHDIPRFGLVPVGCDTFRFAGWTTERTVTVRRVAGTVTEVTLTTRCGGREWERSLEAHGPRRPADSAPRRYRAATVAMTGRTQVGERGRRC